MTKEYTVDYTLGADGWWTATVRNIPGASTQGRDLVQARRRIREALGLFVEGAESAKLVAVIKPQQQLASE